MISTFDQQPIWSGAVGGDVRCRPPYRGHFQTSTWSRIPILAKAPSESPCEFSTCSKTSQIFLCFPARFFHVRQVGAGWPFCHPRRRRWIARGLVPSCGQAASDDMMTSWRPPEVSVGGDPSWLKSLSCASLEK